jgi:hypothetical protein
MGKSVQAKIHAKIHGDGKARGRPTTTASAREELPPRVITAGTKDSSFGTGFQQNGRHDLSSKQSRWE